MGRFCGAITLSGWLIWAALAGAQAVAPVKIASMAMTWKTFLNAHIGEIAAIDPLTVDAVPRLHGIAPLHESLDAIAQLARKHAPPVVAMTGAVGWAVRRHTESRCRPGPGMVKAFAPALARRWQSPRRGEQWYVVVVTRCSVKG